jgi:hypothetical protein
MGSVRDARPGTEDRRLSIVRPDGVCVVDNRVVVTFADDVASLDAGCPHSTPRRGNARVVRNGRTSAEPFSPRGGGRAVTHSRPRTVARPRTQHPSNTFTLNSARACPADPAETLVF